MLVIPPVTPGQNFSACALYPTLQTLSTWAPIQEAQLLTVALVYGNSMAHQPLWYDFSKFPIFYKILSYHGLSLHSSHNTHSISCRRIGLPARSSPLGRHDTLPPPIRSSLVTLACTSRLTTAFIQLPVHMQQPMRRTLMHHTGTSKLISVVVMCGSPITITYTPCNIHTYISILER